MREGKHQNPTTVHFMPNLSCPQMCKFCSYGHRHPDDGPEQQGWKNTELVDETQYMSCLVMKQSVASWMRMGIKSIELTGGGEPLTWAYTDEFLRLVAAEIVTRQDMY